MRMGLVGQPCAKSMRYQPSEGLTGIHMGLVGRLCLGRDGAHCQRFNRSAAAIISASGPQ